MVLVKEGGGWMLHEKSNLLSISLMIQFPVMHNVRAQRRLAVGVSGSQAPQDPTGKLEDVRLTLPAEGEYCVVTEVKKSKFHAYAWHTKSPEEAMGLIQQRKDDGASHNCFGYKIGEEVRSSDDGEPGGTAGRPILAAIEGMNMDQVAVMVTRYFGGVKLGTGGLVRAYGGAAREVLTRAPHEVVIPREHIEILVPIEDIGVVYNVLESVGAEKCDETFDEASGSKYQIMFLVECHRREEALTALNNGSKGRIVLVSDNVV